MIRNVCNVFSSPLASAKATSKSHGTTSTAVVADAPTLEGATNLVSGDSDPTIGGNSNFAVASAASIVQGASIPVLTATSDPTVEGLNILLPGYIDPTISGNTNCAVASVVQGAPILFLAARSNPDSNIA